MQEGERDGSRLLDVIRDDAAVMMDGEDALLEVIERVRVNGGKGSVSLKFSVERPKNANPSDVSVTITGAVTASSPRPVREAHRWYQKDGGELSKFDPRQPAMPGFTMVHNDTGEIPDAGAQAQERQG